MANPQVCAHTPQSPEDGGMVWNSPSRTMGHEPGGGQVRLKKKEEHPIPVQEDLPVVSELLEITKIGMGELWEGKTRSLSLKNLGAIPREPTHLSWFYISVYSIRLSFPDQLSHSFQVHSHPWQWNKTGISYKQLVSVQVGRSQAYQFVPKGFKKYINIDQKFHFQEFSIRK